MPTELSGRKFGWRVAWRLLLFLTAMFGVPFALYGLDRLYGDPTVTAKDAVRLTTGTWVGVSLYLLFMLSMIRPCWQRAGALDLPRPIGLIVPLLMLLDYPFFVAGLGTTYFGPSLGSLDVTASVYLMTGLGLSAALALACPTPMVFGRLQRRLGAVMLIVVSAVVAQFAFGFFMAAWLHVLGTTLATDDPRPPAFVPLVMANGWLMRVNPLLCAALLGLAAWWAIASRRQAENN